MRNRKIFQFGLVVLAIVLLGAVSTISARAAVVTNGSYSIDGDTVNNPCTDSSIVMTGNIHELFAITFDESGGAHLKFHLQTQDVSGIENDTGDLYKVISVGNMHENYIVENEFPFTGTYIVNVRYIGRGSAPNFNGQLHGHITVNANGETTSEFYFENETCN